MAPAFISRVFSAFTRAFIVSLYAFRGRFMHTTLCMQIVGAPLANIERTSAVRVTSIVAFLLLVSALLLPPASIKRGNAERGEGTERGNSHEDITDAYRIAVEPRYRGIRFIRAH